MAWFFGWLAVGMGLGGTCGYLDPLGASGSMPLMVTAAIGAITNAAAVGLMYQSLPPDPGRRLWIAGVAGALLALVLVGVNWYAGNSVAAGVCRADVGFVTGVAFTWVPIGSIVGFGLGIVGLGVVGTYGLTPDQTTYLDDQGLTRDGVTMGTLILGIVTVVVAMVWGRTFPQRR